MSGMSIENMVRVSRLLYLGSGAFAVIAVLLFFLFEITKCQRMISKKHLNHKENQKMGRKIQKNTQTEQLDSKPEATAEDLKTVLLWNESEILPNSNLSEKRINKCPK